MALYLDKTLLFFLDESSILIHFFTIRNVNHFYMGLYFIYGVYFYTGLYFYFVVEASNSSTP